MTAHADSKFMIHRRFQDSLNNYLGRSNDYFMNQNNLKYVFSSEIKVFSFLDLIRDKNLRHATLH